MLHPVHIFSIRELSSIEMGEKGAHTELVFPYHLKIECISDTTAFYLESV